MDFYLYLTLKGLPYDLYLLLGDLSTGEAYLYPPEPRPWPLAKRRGLIKLETLCVLDVIGPCYCHSLVFMLHLRGLIID